MGKIYSIATFNKDLRSIFKCKKNVIANFLEMNEHISFLGKKIIVNPPYISYYIFCVRVCSPVLSTLQAGYFKERLSEFREWKYTESDRTAVQEVP